MEAQAIIYAKLEVEKSLESCQKSGLKKEALTYFYNMLEVEKRLIKLSKNGFEDTAATVCTEARPPLLGFAEI